MKSGRSCLQWLCGAAMMSAAVVATGCDRPAILDVHVDGAITDAITVLWVKLTPADPDDPHAIGPAEGNTTIPLPSNFYLEVFGLDDEAPLTIEVVASVGVINVASDSVDVTLNRDEVTRADLFLVPLTAECGNSAIDPGEECDGADLGGSDCMLQGFTGGTLICGGGCLFDTGGCTTDVPTIPTLREPMNNSYVGLAHLPFTLDVTFSWEPSNGTGGATPLTYDLELSEIGPGSWVSAATMVSGTTFTAGTLMVNTMPPVGRRYYWRVRACEDTNCSAWSEPWWVNVGRSPKDFDGDGYADVIVGAPEAGPGGTNPGRVYRFAGGAPFDTTVDEFSTGLNAGDAFGAGVSYAGDVNGDGFADLLVAASYFGGTDGRVSLYLGGSPSDLMEDASFAGAAGEFWGTVSGIGDVNGDGYDDIKIGSGLAAGGDGRVNVYLGGDGPFDTNPDVVITGAAGSGERLGFAGASGDFNGDGYSDLVVGGPQHPAGGMSTGRAYVHFGGPAGPADTADVTLTGLDPGDLFAGTLTAGDVDGDGFSDLLVGARRHDAIATPGLEGSVYLFWGGPAGVAGTADETFDGSDGDAEFGRVHVVGDLNGDGFDDFTIGALLTDVDGFTDDGAAWLYLGAPRASFSGMPELYLDACMTMAMCADDANFGVGRGIGDVNGDGFADLAMSAPYLDISARPGEVFIYLGNDPFDVTEDFTLLGEAMGNTFGAAIASLFRLRTLGGRMLL